MHYKHRMSPALAASPLLTAPRAHYKNALSRLDVHMLTRSLTVPRRGTTAWGTYIIGDQHVRAQSVRL